VPFAVRLARREIRSSGRSFGLYMGAVALGVAALVALNSFRANVVDSVRAEAKSLLGADLRLASSAPFPEPVRAVLDSLAGGGADVAEVTRLPSMVLAPSTGVVRLLQVQAVAGAYPFFGEYRTEPAGLWPLAAGERRALVDPAVLVQLGVAPGDSVVVGETRFEVAGTLADRGGEVGLQSAIGPRIYIPGAFLEETGLIRTGSLVEYESFLRFDGDAERFRREHRDAFREHRVGIQTAQGQIERLIRTIGTLGSFLALIGLTSVLLGGVAVASAVHHFVEGRLTSVAVLRCLGASQREIFAAYLLQTAALGAVGAMVGAAGGIVVQALLPRLLAGLVPVGVDFAVHWPSVAAGLGVGVWVALAFALLPLLRVREVEPIRALRREAVERRRPAGATRDLDGRTSGGRRPWDRWRVAAYLAVGGSVVALSVLQAPGWRSGLAFAGSVWATLGLLYLLALFLVGATRRHFPRRAGYTLRQGVSNLFRPRNQTVAVTLSLGFGVFLIGIIFLAQHSILDRFRLDAAAGRPNLLLFDVQPDQRAGVLELLARHGAGAPEVTPLVPGRIVALGGRPVAELLRERAGDDGAAGSADRPADNPAEGGRGQPSRWALRREYRNTYRALPAETERLVAGAWWDGPGAAESNAAARAPGAVGSPAARLARISVEAELADELGIGVGDRVTWDFQGVTIETEVASLREVDWAQFAPNFFVVFEPGVLEAAPQSLIVLARLEDAGERAVLQRDLVLEYPNVSVLDLNLIQGTVEEILGRIALAVRFLALFAVGVGVVVLVGALRASQGHRLRESALLRTLGASRRQVRAILFTEYLALGALAAGAGTAYATLAGWPLVTLLFRLPYRPPVLLLLAACAGLALTTALVGVLNGRAATRRPPLATLREGVE
jgi:putative ABC transport system permease protein